MVGIYIYFFVVGAVFGSFFNVVGLRIPKKMSIVTPRSHCVTCKRPLKASELIPIFSYIFLKGKCRGCGEKISPIYPLFELFSGLLFVFSLYHFGFQPELIVALTFISLLLIIVISDLHYMIIPNKVLLFFLPLFIVERMFVPLTPWWDSIVGAGAGFLLLFLIFVLSKGGMGGGDIKLYFLIGYVLGLKATILSFFLASFIGAIIGLIGRICGKIEKKEPVPFGPFIAIGSIIAYFYGDALISLYITYFLKG